MTFALLILAVSMLVAWVRATRHYLLYWHGRPLDPSHFTHHAKMFGVPCLFKSDGEGCDLSGTNFLFDWYICDVAPLVYFAVSYLRHASDPYYEDEGWPILVGPEIERQ